MVMSSFFTTPASQRKKRASTTDRADGVKNQKTGYRQRNAQKRRDDSISESEEEEEEESDGGVNGNGLVQDDISDSGSGSEYGRETVAERRLRLAEQYLQNLKEEIGEGQADAAEIDRDLIAERLKQDAAEGKGRVCLWIASGLAVGDSSSVPFRADQDVGTGVAICEPHLYTTTKGSISKWKLPPASDIADHFRSIHRSDPSPHPKPTLLLRRKNLPKKKQGQGSKPDGEIGHNGRALCVAVSSSGKFVVTGGSDRHLVIWDADSMTPLKRYSHHRDAVTGLAFRAGTTQLYSASADRTVKVWSVEDLAYIETLFGHQDTVVNVAAMASERCVSVGARDRTARLWKVAEESQLVYRGGGLAKVYKDKHGDQTGNNHVAALGRDPPPSVAEGSIDCVAVIDEETFVTGGDSGTISLWNIHKKKPVFTCPLAHGSDPPAPPEELSAEEFPVPADGVTATPRWITALAAVHLSDVILSASWDGFVRVWRLSQDRRKLEPGGAIRCGERQRGDATTNGAQNGGIHDPLPTVKGIVNDLAVIERGSSDNKFLSVVASVGIEPRLGRWKKYKGRNGCVLIDVPYRSLCENTNGP